MKLLQTLKKIDKVMEKVATYIAFVTFVSIVLIMLFICASVFGRMLFSKSINGSYEIVEVSMGICVFAAMAYTQVSKSHVQVTLIISHLPQRLKMTSFSLTSLLTAGLVGFVGYATAKAAMVAASTNTVTPVLRLPYSAFYSWESFCMWAFFIVLFYDTVKSFIAIFNKQLAEDIQSYWT